jgi:biopolymer transport protein ExbD
MKTFEEGKPPRTEINITSLIDVIFMLVVFFMLGASFEKPAVTLTLPQASSRELPERLSLTVMVDSGGRIFFEGTELDHASLLSRLSAYGPELQTVALECDSKADFGNAVAVMDIIKNAGARNVAIRHDPQ